MLQSNLTGADLEEEGDPEEEDPNPEKEVPMSSDATALIPVGGPVGSSDEDDPHLPVGRRAMMHFSDPGMWYRGEVTAVHPPDPPTQREVLCSVNFEGDDTPDFTLAESRQYSARSTPTPGSFPGASTGVSLTSTAR